MQVEHLIVDSSAFIHNGPIREKGKNIYSCQEVLDEIKDQATRERLNFLPYELKLLQIDEQDLEECIEFAKKTGDYKQLSLVDLKLIAATYRLEKQFNGTKNINKEPKQKASKPRDPSRDSFGGGWITPNNISKKKPSESWTEDRILVACMTSDFSIQNCLLQLGLLAVSPVDGLVIREAKKIALRCHACFKVFHDPSKIKNDFCPHCGNLGTLKRVQYVIDKDGAKTVLINYKKPIRVKGTNQQLPRPRGGKHANNPILAPDQPVRKDKQDKFAVREKKTVNAEFILQDPAYLVRTNPFAYRSYSNKRK